MKVYTFIAISRLLGPLRVKVVASNEYKARRMLFPYARDDGWKLEIEQ